MLTRFLFVLNNFAKYDLNTFDFKKTFAENGLDEFEIECLITSIEHEFHTVFEDYVFESFENLEQVKDWVLRDHNCF